MSECRQYRIVVGGHLTQRLAAAFDGLTLAQGDGCTVIHAEADQAQLHGVLTRIRDLGIELVSVDQPRREATCR